ncbi:MAG: LamG domain-containing protein [Isosphaeraceae bacterium]
MRAGLFAVTCLLACPTFAWGSADDTLLGHWPLRGDARDVSGHHRDGRSESVIFDAVGPSGSPDSAARFDGTRSRIVVPVGRELHLNRNDFTVALWVHTAKDLDDSVGDLVSQFDPELRRGFQLSIKSGAGTTTSQSNLRNIQFGIDSGTAPVWTDRGRPGQAVYIMAMAVHNGALFVGTCEPGPNEAGHVYRHDGGQRWVDCGVLDGSNAVTALASHDGHLYAGTGAYRLAGSSLVESQNTKPGGRVFRLDESGSWTNLGQLPGFVAVGGLVTFQGRLLASSLYRPAGLFRLEGTQWEPQPLPPDGRRVVALTVFEGKLYATSYDACAVYCFDGKEWKSLGQLESSGQTYSFEVLGGKLHVGTWPNGRVFRLDPGSQWADAGRLGEEKEVMGMAVHNGKLYAGTLPLAEVYRHESNARWVSTGRVDLTPDVRYRRAWSMAVFQGQLFCGTLPSGRVHSLTAGLAVSHDRALPGGWHHIAALRRAGRLELHLDGHLVAESGPKPSTEILDLDTDRPLEIGSGPYDHLNGRLSDVRLYGRALSAGEVSALASSQPPK